MKPQHKTTYKATYTDQLGAVDIWVENDFETMRFEIEGIRFEGFQFADFECQNPIEGLQAKRFSFDKYQDLKNDKIDYSLTNFALEVEIPQILIDIESQTTIEISMILNFELGKKLEKYELKIIINQEIYIGTGDMIEFAFDKLKTQIDHKYKFKNCYGCLLGDYNIYGNSGFGNMLCYESQKEAYLNAEHKFDFMDLQANTVQVQEIYCCPNFEIRQKGTGYRG